MNHKAQLISDMIKLEKEFERIKKENETLRLQITILSLQLKEYKEAKHE